MSAAELLVEAARIEAAAQHARLVTVKASQC